MPEEETQRDLVLEYLKTHEGITQLEALEHLGVSRLSARILELIRDGIPITKTWVEVVNRRGATRRVIRYGLKKCCVGLIERIPFPD